MGVIALFLVFVLLMITTIFPPFPRSVAIEKPMNNTCQMEHTDTVICEPDLIPTFALDRVFLNEGNGSSMCAHSIPGEYVANFYIPSLPEIKLQSWRYLDSIDVEMEFFQFYIGFLFETPKPIPK